MSKQLKCKFSANSVTNFGGGSQEVKLAAVYDSLNNEENNQFSQATPSGSLEMYIDNPSAIGFIKPGRDYFLYIEEAPEQD